MSGQSSGFNTSKTLVSHPGYVIGRRYTGLGLVATNVVTPGSTISGVPAARMWLYYDPVPQRVLVDQLGAWVYDMPDANGMFMLGVYGADPVTHLPTGLPLLAAANPGPTSMAAVGVNLALATPKFLETGPCWRAFMTNSSTARFLGPSPLTLALTGSIGAINGANPAAQSGVPCALAYGTPYGPWPNLTGTGEASFVMVAGPYAPAVWFRPAVG